MKKKSRRAQGFAAALVALALPAVAKESLCIEKEPVSIYYLKARLEKSRLSFCTKKCYALDIQRSLYQSYPARRPEDTWEIQKAEEKFSLKPDSTGIKICKKMAQPAHA